MVTALEQNFDLELQKKVLHYIRKKREPYLQLSENTGGYICDIFFHFRLKRKKYICGAHLEKRRNAASSKSIGLGFFNIIWLIVFLYFCIFVKYLEKEHLETLLYLYVLTWISVRITSVGPSWRVPHEPKRNDLLANTQRALWWFPQVMLKVQLVEAIVKPTQIV